MGEQIEDRTGDVDMTNSEITFDNLAILKEFSNIANVVSIEDFMETVPKAKLKRVKWVLMFNVIKQDILDDMVQEFSSMWEHENMSTKLEILEKQKEKFSEFGTDKQMWRPQLEDVKAQLKARDVVNWQKQKVQFESLAKEYETRVQNLKKLVTAKRGYLKALQLDIQKYQRKSEDFVTKINDRLENHRNLKLMLPNGLDVNEVSWSGDLDV